MMAKNLHENAYNNFMMSTFSYLPLNEQEPYETMYGLIQETEAEVVIFDPMIRFHDVDENTASQMSEVFGRLRRYIEELHISIILFEALSVNSLRNFDFGFINAAPGKIKPIISNRS